jgi:hypothetical protein
MRLPGGIIKNKQRKRDFSFYPVTGAIEFKVAQIAEQDLSLPQMVSQVLLATLEQLAGQRVTAPDVAALCVVDRQFLMRQLQWHLGDQQTWFTANCQACRQHFDFELDIPALPVNEGGDEYPLVTVSLADGEMQFRFPNGDDQCAMCDVDENEARLLILNNCLITPVDSVDLLAQLSQEQIDSIEQAMDESSPAIVSQIEVKCANCEGINSIYLDSYQVLNRGYGDLLGDIHRIASAYHWSEQDILVLPNQRRQNYLRLIDADRGLSG